MLRRLKTAERIRAYEIREYGWQWAFVLPFSRGFPGCLETCRKLRIRSAIFMVLAIPDQERVGKMGKESGKTMSSGILSRFRDCLTPRKMDMRFNSV